MAVRSHLYSSGTLLRSCSWACEISVEAANRTRAPGRWCRAVAVLTGIGGTPSQLDEFQDQSKAGFQPGGRTIKAQKYQSILAINSRRTQIIFICAASVLVGSLRRALLISLS